MQIINAPAGLRVWESRCDHDTQPVLFLALVQDDRGRRVCAQALRQGQMALYEMSDVVPEGVL